MKTILSIFLFVLVVGCTTAKPPHKLTPDQQLDIMVAQVALIEANTIAAPYVQAAQEKEAARNLLTKKALESIQCPLCQIQLVGGKLIVTDPPAPPPPVIPPVKK